MYLLDAFIAIILITTIIQACFTTSTNSIRKLGAYILAGGTLTALVFFVPMVFGVIFDGIQKGFEFLADLKFIVPPSVYQGINVNLIPVLVMMALFALFVLIFRIILHFTVKELHLERRLLGNRATTNLPFNIFIHLIIGLTISYVLLISVTAVYPILPESKVIGYLYQTSLEQNWFNLIIEFLNKIVDEIPAAWIGGN